MYVSKHVCLVCLCVRIHFLCVCPCWFMDFTRWADLCNVLFGFCGQVGVCPGAGTLSVRAASGTKAWLRAQEWLCKYAVKVARLKMQPELGPPRVSSGSVGPSYPFSFADMWPEKWWETSLEFFFFKLLSASRAIIRCPWGYEAITSIGLCCLFNAMLL